MRRIPLKSSSILSAGYDEATRTLELEFASFAVYAYYQVPPSIYAAFQAAGSKGHFHALYLAGKYEYKCVVPRPTKESKSHGETDTQKEKKVRQVKADAQRAAKHRIS